MREKSSTHGFRSHNWFSPAGGRAAHLARMLCLLLIATVALSCAPAGQARPAAAKTKMKPARQQSQPDSPFHGPEDPRELAAFLDEFFTRRMAALRIPGAAIVVVKDGGIFFSQGYGHGDAGKMMTVDPKKTVFAARSVSKAFAATAIMQLYEQGRIDLRADVDNYLGGLRLGGDYTDPVTVAGLLTHSAGLGSSGIGSLARTQAEILPLERYLGGHMPARIRAPGEVVGYTDAAPTLAGYVVQAVSGLPFEQYVRENILLPLGMKNSSFHRTAALDPYLAQGYRFHEGAYHPMPYGYFNTSPAASLVTSAEDMAPFMIAHLRDGAFGDVRILREATAREMHRQQFTNHPRLPGVTYGFFEHVENNQRAILHSGLGVGFGSLLFLLPEHDLGFYLVYNLEEPTLRWELVTRFLDRYFPSEPAPTVPAVDAPATRPDLAGSYAQPGERHTLAAARQVFDAVEVRANDDGSLTLLSDGTRWIEVAPLFFEQVGDPDRHLAFRQDERSGAIYMFPEHSFRHDETLEKLSWNSTLPGFLAAQLFFMLAFLSGAALLAGPLRNRLRRRTAAATPARDSLPRLARATAGALSLANLVVLAGLPISMLLYSDTLEFDFGVPLPVLIILVLALVAAAATVSLIAFAVLAWKRSYWTLPARLHYSMLAAASLLFILFLDYWNLLGFRFG